MARFIQTSPLDVAHTEGDWITCRPIIYRSDLTDRLIEVPIFFVTDLASIPWWARSLIPVNGHHRNAAVIHDYLYRRCRCWCPRLLADQIFREAMAVLRESSWKRNAMYLAVRSGGGKHWQECTNKFIERN